MKALHACRVRLARRVFAAVLFVFCASMGVGASAQVASGNVLAFDHASTGFRLDGGHLRAPCESCHRNGIFRGTPRACAICHSRGGLGMAEGMPPSHVPVSATCSSCHSTIAWTPANFRHRADQGVTTGDCGSCHNGSTARASPPVTRSPPGHVTPVTRPRRGCPPATRMRSRNPANARAATTAPRRPESSPATFPRRRHAIRVTRPVRVSRRSPSASPRCMRAWPGRRPPETVRRATAAAS